MSGPFEDVFNDPLKAPDAGLDRAHTRLRFRWGVIFSALIIVTAAALILIGGS